MRGDRPNNMNHQMPDLSLLQQQLDQQHLHQLQQSQQQHNFSTFTPLNTLMNSNQFAASQANNNTQAVFNNNMNAPISSAPVQSSLNPNAKDFASRTTASFVPSAYTSRPAHPPPLTNQPPPYVNNGVNNTNGNIFPGLNNLANSIDMNPINIENLLKATASLQLQQQSPQTSPPASPTPGLQQQQMMDDRYSRQRPIGTERAQKRSVVTGPPPNMLLANAPPPSAMSVPPTPSELWNPQQNPAMYMPVGYTFYWPLITLLLFVFL